MRTLMGILSFILGTQSSGPVYADASKFTVIDVRTAEEYKSGHVDGALNIDFLKNDFDSQIGKLDKSKTYKVYCRSGNRSGQAEKKMKAIGITDVENLGSLEQAMKRLSKN